MRYALHPRDSRYVTRPGDFSKNYSYHQSMSTKRIGCSLCWQQSLLLRRAAGAKRRFLSSQAAPAPCISSASSISAPPETPRAQRLQTRKTARRDKSLIKAARADTAKLLEVVTKRKASIPLIDAAASDPPWVLLTQRLGEPRDTFVPLNKAFLLDPSYTPADDADLQAKSKAARSAMQLLLPFAASGNVDGALSVYSVARSQHMVPTRDCFDLLLGICARHKRYDAARAILTSLAATEATPTEPMWRLMVQMALVGEGSRGSETPLQTATAVLNALDAVGTPPRYRTYEPIVAALAEQQDIRALRALAQRMKDRDVVPPMSFYTEVAEACARSLSTINSSSSSSSSEAVAETAAELNAALDWVLQNLSQLTDHLPEEGVGGRLAAALQHAQRLVPEPVTTADGVDASSTASTTAADADATTADAAATAAGEQCLASHTAQHSAHSEHHHISAAGVCSCCSGQLTRVGLTWLQRGRLRSAVMSMAAGEGAGRALAVADFAKHLRSLPQPPTAVIDGPNVAYFGQNFHGGEFSYLQVRVCMLCMLYCHCSTFLSPSEALSYVQLAQCCRIADAIARSTVKHCVFAVAYTFNTSNIGSALAHIESSCVHLALR
jgi:Pentacotripeptide-repeat region of PRORP